jgi:hypothetical protein
VSWGLEWTGKEGKSKADLGSTITQFLDYLDNFARYKEEDSLHSIAALFDAHPELTVVEKALLGNRAGVTVEARGQILTRAQAHSPPTPPKRPQHSSRRCKWRRTSSRAFWTS